MRESLKNLVANCSTGLFTATSRLDFWLIPFQEVGKTPMLTVHQWVLIPLLMCRSCLGHPLNFDSYVSFMLGKPPLNPDFPFSQIIAIVSHIFHPKKMGIYILSHGLMTIPQYGYPIQLCQWHINPVHSVV